MNPIAMALLFVVMFGLFGWTMSRRWRLMNIGPQDLKFDQFGRRLNLMLRFAIGQWRMPRHKLAGVAHVFIYLGAVVMLLRALMLFARGFIDDPHFGYWIFTTGPNGAPLGHVYSLIKDIFVVLVLIGVAVFFYYRAIRHLPRPDHQLRGLSHSGHFDRVDGHRHALRRGGPGSPW